MKARYVILPEAVIFGGFSGEDKDKISRLCAKCGYKGIPADKETGNATVKTILQGKPDSTDTPVTDEKFVIIHGGKPSVILDLIKSAGYDIPLRAVTTPTSQGWTLNQLIVKLKAEKQELEGV